MEDIASVIEQFLAGSRIRKVHFAQPGQPPPELAFMVNFPRISITLKGLDSMLVEQADAPRQIHVAAAEALVIPPNCWNRPDWSRPATVLNFLTGPKHIGLSLVSHGGGGGSPSRGYKASLPDVISSPERHLAHALLDTGLRLKPEAAPAILDALLISLLNVLRQPVPHKSRNSISTHEVIALYIQHNFAFPLTRESVADHFHLSPGHVSRLFRKEGLIGFNEYLNQVRIDRAKFLLRSHPISLDEISSKCGYSDTAYFCRVFKRLVKTTPSNYRNSSR
jgi:AraC-like DNA-binding protein